MQQLELMTAVISLVLPILTKCHVQRSLCNPIHLKGQLGTALKNPPKVAA